jgi:hypothetical protein
VDMVWPAMNAGFMKLVTRMRRNADRVRVSRLEKTVVPLGTSISSVSGAIGRGLSSTSASLTQSSRYVCVFW